MLQQLVFGLNVAFYRYILTVKKKVSMKNTSIFLDFEHTNTSVAQWLYFLKQLNNIHPVFCNTFNNAEQTTSTVNMLIKADTHEEFIKQRKTESYLPENLKTSFNSENLFPVFNIDEVLESDRLLNELIDTDMIVICCKSLDQNGLTLDSLTAKILNKAKCPVIFIPENVNDGPQTKKIVFNTDIRFTELRLTRAIARLCDYLKSNLTIAHVSNSGIPDLDDSYGEILFEDNFKYRLGKCKTEMINIKKDAVKKYPDMIHEFLKGDIYTTVNKNRHLKAQDTFSNVAIQFAALAQTPLLVINS